MPAKPARQRLTEAAFALFEERGYDATTIEDITERAGVGRTTFFRAFRSKEEVIFPDHEILLGAIGNRLDGADPRTALVAVTEAARLVLRHYVAEGDLALARYRLTRSVPALRAREIAGTQQYQRLFREFVHRWLGGGESTALRAELLAAAVVTAHNHVLRRWLRGQSTNPEAEFDAAMADTVAVFGTRADEPGTTVIAFRTGKDLSAVLPGLRRLLGDEGVPG
ncbi:TetR/AcrR family transcriptional regulator [Amycolatopsis jiangsuensis]|uniref:AcrR family transcriptional regulator n=1 Tax=Amycolatopsis jiangsuensis TaxID=1181879 RepID=A0A840IRW0_9PSEU|nr:TetR/AcrR family transcriptional regulator [Amycolatopsis jiangsuensis]MBB4684279.1 AcrR family transcriptional regulator [Amycolatopsis jiangsuensis]